MKQKILTFIYSKKNNKFLALRNNPHPDHGGDFWFVVTGGLEGEETHKEAARREVKEETNLDMIEILNLNWSSIYEWNNELCREINFLGFAEDPEDIRLDQEEVIEHKWLNLDEFINLINWQDDKGILKKVLEKAIKNRLHFQEDNIIDYRRK